MRFIYRFGLELVEEMGDVEIFGCEHFIFGSFLGSVQFDYDFVVDVEDLWVVVHLAECSCDEIETTEGFLEVRILKFNLGPLIIGFIIDDVGDGESLDVGEWVSVIILQECFDGVGVGVFEEFLGHFFWITIKIYQALLKISQSFPKSGF